MSVPESVLRPLIAVLRAQTDCLRELQVGMGAQREAFVQLHASPVQGAVQELETIWQRLAELETHRERSLEDLAGHLPPGTRLRVSALLPLLAPAQARSLRRETDAADRAARALRGETRAAERLLRLSQEVNSGILTALAGPAADSGSGARAYDKNARSQDPQGGGRLVLGTA